MRNLNLNWIFNVFIFVIYVLSAHINNCVLWSISMYYDF